MNPTDQIRRHDLRPRQRALAVAKSSSGRVRTADQIGSLRAPSDPLQLVVQAGGSWCRLGDLPFGELDRIRSAIAAAAEATAAQTPTNHAGGS